jgi:DMSO/TMAO reductase YedYZ heme-binding membrane subunit
MHDVRRPKRWFQFPLSYLIYLLTLAALGFALLRRVLDIHGGWKLTAFVSAYVAVLIAYFAFRFPVLFGRLRRGNQSLRARRAKMANLVDDARRAAEKEPER